MNRKDYDCKDGFKYITSQQKEVGKCCGASYNPKSGYEKCKNREKCSLYQEYEKSENKWEVQDWICRLPIKWFRKCKLYEKGGQND